MANATTTKHWNGCRTAAESPIHLDRAVLTKIDPPSGCHESNKFQANFNPFFAFG